MIRAALMLVALGACVDGADPADPDPVFSAADRARLQTLRYDDDLIAADPSNAYTDSAAAQRFGQRLFFDTGLSGPLTDRDNDGTPGTLGAVGAAGKVACASCHVATDRFVDTRSPHRQISLAARWSSRRTPTLLEAAASPRFNWDGRRDSLWAQAIGVMENAGEFNASRLFVAEQLFARHRAEYEAIFGPMPALDDAARFPALAPTQAGCDAGPIATAPCRGKPGAADYEAMALADRELVTRVTVNGAKALGAYVALLRCGPSRFDAWLDGDDDALSRAEQRGAAIFVGRGDCVRCHDGPALTDREFHNVGLRPSTVAVAFTDVDDHGAATGIAGAADDPLDSLGAFSDGARDPTPTIGPALEGAFKTPTLRCLARQPSFMHTAQLRTLADVTAFFDRGGEGAGYPGTRELTPLGLDDREAADLTAFVLALDGDGPDPRLLAAP